jgi:hypothetical protein
LVQDDSEAAGVDVLTGGTDVHLALVDFRNSPVDGQQAEDLLHHVGITVNRNAVPFDPRPPMVTSGVRIGTPALATRGFGDTEFTEVADIIAHTLMPNPDVSASAGSSRGVHPGVAAVSRAFLVPMRATTLDGDRYGPGHQERKIADQVACSPRSGGDSGPGHNSGRRGPWFNVVRRGEAQGLR